MKQFIGIKRIWYANPIAAIAGATLTGAEIKALLAKADTKEVKNSHQDTWGYTEEDPTITDYINELTGKIYYRDVTQDGAVTIAFTLGEYEYTDKAALQGGKATATGWDRPDRKDNISKCIIAQTKTGNYIVFPNASIVGKGNFVEKNIGLGVTAVAMETGVTGLASEVWRDKAEVEAEEG